LNNLQKYKGIYLTNSNNFIVRIRKDGKLTSFGCFNSLREAKAVYDREYIILHEHMLKRKIHKKYKKLIKIANESFIEKNKLLKEYALKLRQQKYREAHREDRKLYVKEHATEYCMYANKRRAAKINASKDWGELNQFIIEEAYKLSRLRSDLTGIEWQVDHIIPLIHPKVCGLHVGINLQVITAIENLNKRNKFEVN